MEIVELKDKQVIAEYLRQDSYLNIYQLGDLDDFFWPFTQWWGLHDGNCLRAVVLLYTGLSAPTVLALAEQDRPALIQLVEELLPHLPPQAYIHYSSGLGEMLQRRYELRPRGEHLKMGLRSPEALDGVAVDDVLPLHEADEKELIEFYTAAYPGNWFDRRMLQTERYYGIRRAGKLACVAGVHVVSREYGVAALGNIATHPDWRGRGLARMATAKLCRQLLHEGCEIGLNVKADNVAAISCYQALGFREVARYHEAEALLRSNS